MVNENKLEFIVTIFRPLADQVPSHRTIFKVLHLLGEWEDIPDQQGHLQDVWLRVPAGPGLTRSNHRTVFEVPPSANLKCICQSEVIWLH